MQENQITIEKVSEHNLKEISVKIPHNKLTVITGVSGSGKSSLAFNTIFQEGQRLYISSLSSYARQYLQNYDKPKVEKIEGLSPTISIDQKTVGRSNRSTVGTVTGIYDFLRLMFARLGNAYCPNGHGLLQGQSKESIEQHVFHQFKGKKILILAPVVFQKKGTYRKELELYAEQGFRRALINNELKKLNEKISLNRYEKQNIELVIDLITLEDATKPLLLEAISKAISTAEGRVSVLDYETVEQGKKKFTDEEYHFFTTENSCAVCGASALEIEPTLFSFNLSIGQCKTCSGIGVEFYFDEKSLISDSSKPFKQAIDVLNDKGNLPYIGIGNREIRQILKKYKVNVTTAWQKIPAKIRSEILNGDDDGNDDFQGIIPILKEMYFRYRLPMLKKYLEERICSSCHGDRLSDLAKSIKIKDKNITEYNRMTVTEMLQDIEKIKFKDKFKNLIFQPIYKEINERLKFLMHVGLEYLTFDRSANSLSGGEAQRIRLAAQIGSGLEGCMYILDEPSIGLHQSDNRKLIETLRLLRDKNNTVIIIEHDEETMLCSDHLIDIGKFAGVKGGHLVFSDIPQKIFDIKKDVSITGDYLLGRKNIFFQKQKQEFKDFIEIKKVSKNNIAKKDFKIPLNCFVAIAGVSGSGKSTFLEIFVNAIKNHFSKTPTKKNNDYQEILGLEKINRIVEIDQKSIGRTSRSNPATYTKVWDLIRDLYTAQRESKILGYQKGRFSFNVKGGRCEECGGAGVQKIEMEIFADVEIICDSCDGKRFNEATLRIHYNHKSIYDVLEMTIGEAATFFKNQSNIQAILQTMLDVGLGYLKLGQNSTTLSGGEAQRIKLSRELSKNKMKGTLYVLDEPTTGLHLYDIDLLLKSLYRLIEKGNSVVVIEHNMDVLKVADYLIEMGPGAGKEGGNVIAECTPLELSQKKTPTGIELKKFFVREKQRQQKEFLKKNNFQNLLKQFNNNITTRNINEEIEKKVTIRGLKKNNLKNIDVEIIKNTITVVTGPSGSGKTSFAFGSLFQEGQRKYLESMSSYARRFVEKADKVNADQITGIAPTIAINQKHSSANPRSIVATQTEIYDSLRVLYATIGRNKCPVCLEEMKSFNIDDCCDFLFENYLEQKIIFAIPIFKDWTLEEEKIKERKNSSGVYSREIDIKFLLEDFYQFEKYIELFQSKNIVRVMIDGKIYRLEEVTKKHLQEVMTIFLVLDKITIHQENKKQIIENIEKAYLFGDQDSLVVIDEKKNQLLLSKKRHCSKDFFFLKENLNSKYFSFNHPLGSCETCEGIGKVSQEICPDCNGSRLQRDALLTVIGSGEEQYSIADLTRKDIFSLLDFLKKLIKKFSTNEKKIAENIIEDILFRLKQLDLLGLGYISLDRQMSTLSGGEVQRIKLSTQIGNRLQDVIFVLDEPTIGLHEVEIEKLFLAVKKLKELGNTIVAVEHDSTFIKKSDQIIDIGPNAGEHGGEVLYNGENAKNKIQKTSIYPYLYGEKLKQKYRKILPFDMEKDDFFTCSDVTTNNIQQENFSLPLNRLTALTGVSGSGKSSLFSWIKKRRFSNNKNKNNFNVVFESVKFVDQSAVAASVRSTPITYLGLFDEIRLLFANTRLSRERGYTASFFSFNSNHADNTCYECNGLGQQKIEMHFISDITTVCPACNGKRFQQSVLEVYHKGKNIHDVLQMTFEEAHAFFQSSKKIPKKLQFLLDAGLGYLKLGLSMDILSGGELQRLKIAKELMSSFNKNCLYLLDEPTTGLHFSDVEKLVKILDKLVTAGNTILVIEHNIEFLRNCDYFIDMGPGAGKDGGKVVNFGSLEEMKEKKGGETWRYL